MILPLALAAAVLSWPAAAGAADDGTLLVFGIKVSAGGRYDDVRMCIASPAGAKGGPALDVSFFTEIGLKRDVSLTINVPVMRPILFAAAFRMLQFEPEVTLGFRQDAGGKVDLVYGPVVGLTFHYGPDYTSERSGDGRGPSFFAMGPRIGAYLGLDFERPDRTFNFRLGIKPYASPLFPSAGAPVGQGVILGGEIEGQLRFDAGR
jgi:hypothetical protein